MLLLVVSFCLSFFLNSGDALAIGIDKTCRPLEIVYARGSGGGAAKDDLGQLFDNSLKLHTTTPSADNIYYLGTEKYNEAQYSHVSVGGWKGLVTALGASIGSGKGFTYGKSVEGGVSELKGYLDKRLKKCSGSTFALAGFSQVSSSVKSYLT